MKDITPKPNPKIHCTTPSCVKAIEISGDRYHNVYDLEQPYTSTRAPVFMPDAVARCESCGGYTDGKGNWKHVCVACGTEVKPGELTGLFVPHLCKDCMRATVEADKKAGRVCSLCRRPYSLCCC